ncbi:glutathione S-transferase kappa 1-like protein [Tribonema minus]|uniref:Glutathione S-transferase kappa n=1 Tax=Tribonema minus TaxID=303371 RepID=A0A835YPJ2_9STRA|nr:glutathione S-transferase kappa 1-like protein [Tribonema minus]
MALTRPCVSLLYDVASPYSWLAFEVCDRYTKIWDADIKFNPFLLGGVMKATGNAPPGALPAKRVYMREDLARCAKHFNVPLNYIKDGKVLYTSLAAQRLLTAVSLDEPALLRPLSRALWLRIWSANTDIAQQESLAAACAAAGATPRDAAALLLRSTEPDVKERLRAVTQVAIDRGAFGAPTLIVTLPGGPPEGDLFFGCDRFDQLAAAIGQPWLGPDPLSNAASRPLSPGAEPHERQSRL